MHNPNSKRFGVRFQSITDGVDTKTPAGRFFFHVMASLAQMENAPSGLPVRLLIGCDARLARAADWVQYRGGIQRSNPHGPAAEVRLVAEACRSSYADCRR
jgi:hypothetical protein